MAQHSLIVHKCTLLHAMATSMDKRIAIQQSAAPTAANLPYYTAKADATYDRMAGSEDLNK